MSRRSLSVVAAILLAGLGACVALLPDRYAVSLQPVLNSLFGWGGSPPVQSDVEQKLRVPADYEISLYALVPRVRMLLATPRGDLLASVAREGRVVLLARDKDDDDLPDGSSDLLSGLDRPHGLALHDGWLYVAEGSAIGRVRFDVATGTLAGAYEHIVTGLPQGGNHWSRSVGVGPDGKLYVTVGSSCNACIEEDERRAAMLRFNADGSAGEIYARGLRNAVGFAWRPGTGELYATDNGRDLLGDDIPPCELNRIVAGGDYGWPVAYGDRVPDPDLGAGQSARIAASLPPAFAFRAHNAPLGITFLQHPSQPSAYAGAALVALHGSWNRTSKDGYKVVALHFASDGTIRSEDFLTGFLAGENVIGRPVDIAEAPNSGILYVSDDFAGAIYAIRRKGARPVGPPTAQAARAAAPAPAAVELTPEERAAARARGAALFAELPCASCHDPEHAKKGVVARPLADLARRYDAASLTAFLAAPTPPMPDFGLAEGARRDLAEFLLDRYGAPQ